MKILVTGVKGQLGYDVVKELENRAHIAIGVDKEQMDLTSIIEIKEFIQNNKPDAIIHCGAYTAVDMAEDNQKLCSIINSVATKEIALCAKNLDIPMIYISTDYVFDGCKNIHSEYTEEDETNPINIYGKSKLDGEDFVREILEKYYIVRISWVFGKNGNNFIKSILRLANEKDELNIVNDQIGSPTYTKDLSVLLCDMIETDKYGTYHATNEGYCTWYEFAKEILSLSNIDIKLNEIATKDYKTKAKRPINSKMSKDKLSNNDFNRLRHWKEALRDYLNEV